MLMSSCSFFKEFNFFFPLYERPTNYYVHDDIGLVPGPSLLQLLSWKL